MYGNKSNKVKHQTPQGVDLQATYIETQAHFIKVVTPTQVLNARNSIYAMIINSTTDKSTVPLDQRAGTDEAIKMTESVLNDIMKPMAIVPSAITTTQTQSYTS